MNTFLSHIHAEFRRTRITFRGKSPAAVQQSVRGQTKTYPRMEQVVLPPAEPIALSLSDILERRSSYFGGTNEQRLSPQIFSTLLGNALGKRKWIENRNYPSAGGLYPIETYLITSAFAELPPTVFHYNPKEHVLEKLWGCGDVDIKMLARKPEDLLFSTLLAFTSVWERSSAENGDLAYPYALLEAGHMSQNVLLTATALGLRTRPLGDFDDDALIELLHINPEEEQPVEVIAIS